MMGQDSLSKMFGGSARPIPDPFVNVV